MFGLGAEELVIILAIVVMIFGANRLPELGSGVGKAIRNFKGEIKSIEGGAPEKSGEEPKEEVKTPGPHETLLIVWKAFSLYYLPGSYF